MRNYSASRPAPKAWHAIRTLTLSITTAALIAEPQYNGLKDFNQEAVSAANGRLEEDTLYQQCPNPAKLAMLPKRPLSPSPTSAPTYTSSPITDRSSRFLAIYSPSLSAKTLQAQDNIQTATHRIAAWRQPSTQRALSSQRLFDIGHDDDGEKYGGKALETVLVSLGVEGAVVVARWYGGVMLGPVRFEHIKDCARDAIRQYLEEGEKKAKRVKVEEDEIRRQELIRMLSERDRSIAVLRDLLVEKQQKDGSQKAEKGSPAKVPEYAKLPLPTLASLERARDATIGWILKQIETAEAAQEELSKDLKHEVEGPKKGRNNAENLDGRANEALEVATSPKQPGI